MQIAHELQGKTWRYRFETFGRVIPSRFHPSRFDKFGPIINMSGAIDFKDPQVVVVRITVTFQLHPGESDHHGRLLRTRWISDGAFSHFHGTDGTCVVDV